MRLRLENDSVNSQIIPFLIKIWQVTETTLCRYVQCYLYPRPHSTIFNSNMFWRLLWVNNDCILCITYAIELHFTMCRTRRLEIMPKRLWKRRCHVRVWILAAFERVFYATKNHMIESHKQAFGPFFSASPDFRLFQVFAFDTFFVKYLHENELFLKYLYLVPERRWNRLWRIRRYSLKSCTTFLCPLV